MLIPTPVKVEVWRRDRGQCVLYGSTKNLQATPQLRGATPVLLRRTSRIVRCFIRLSKNIGAIETTSDLNNRAESPRKMLQDNLSKFGLIRPLLGVNETLYDGRLAPILAQILAHTPIVPAVLYRVAGRRDGQTLR
jgi:hypothetical protein